MPQKQDGQVKSLQLMGYVRREWELAIGFVNVEVIANLAEYEIQTGMTFREIGKKRRGKSKCSKC